MGSGNPQDLVTQLLQRLGEDPDREGLKGTPSRVVKSWSEIYAGYGFNPASIFTTFSEVEGYAQIVILTDIELFSMCEHHMLPFFGKAHVAYLPDDKVIGISKLARLVDGYARRLQIQERIGQQVVNDLMQYLKPQGAACIIEASHMCMRMRGCNKQRSIMVTSSLSGVFLEDATIRAELMQLIKMKTNV